MNDNAMGAGRFGSCRCHHCGRIWWWMVWAELRAAIKGRVKSIRRCQSCHKRGVYDWHENQLMCYDCWSGKTGLPF